MICRIRLGLTDESLNCGCIVRLLLAKGSDVRSKDIGGETALHLAAFNGRRTIAQILLSRGADLTAN